MTAESESAREEVQRIAFTDVTTAAGLDAFAHETGALGEKWFPETNGSGGGFIDYNGDGWFDILLVGGGSWKDPESVRALWLYRNNGDGTFTNETEEAGLSGVHAYGFGITVADYDNDGDEDFFLTTLQENMLFRNDGGRFTEVGREAGIAKESAWSTAAIFFDADRDGWPDLYVGNYVDWSPEKDVFCTFDQKTKTYCTPEVYHGTPGRFYLNNGDGTFTDRTETAGFLPAPGSTLGVAELDFNQDGWPDLVVANDQQRNLLYENDGDGTFTEKGLLSGIAYDEFGVARACMGIDAGDVQNSGSVSIFIGNFSNEMIGVFHYIGDGLFSDRAVASQVGQPSLAILTFGLFLFDVDLDGDLDLFTANGHVQQEIENVQGGITYRQPSQLFVNRGDGIFDTMEAGGVMAQPLVARGAAYADFDRDGDLDVLVTENGGPAHLWRNELNPQQTKRANYLRVRVEGRESNRDGLGARLVVEAGERQMERRIRTGASYLSQSEKVATFGLGDEKEADALTVYWPSGQVDRFEQLNVNQEIHIVEGVGTFAQASSLSATH